MKPFWILWAINTTINMFCILYHELWHWMFSWLAVFCNPNGFFAPQLNIEKHGVTQYKTFKEYELTMHIYYEFRDKKHNSVWHLLMLIAPVLGIIFLFVILPFWTYLFIIYKIPILWLSRDDIKKIKHYIKTGSVF